MFLIASITSRDWKDLKNWQTVASPRSRIQNPDQSSSLLPFWPCFTHSQVDLNLFPFEHTKIIYWITTRLLTVLFYLYGFLVSNYCLLFLVVLLSSVLPGNGVRPHPPACQALGALLGWDEGQVAAVGSPTWDRTPRGASGGAGHTTVPACASSVLFQRTALDASAKGIARHFWGCDAWVSSFILTFGRPNHHWHTGQAVWACHQIRSGVTVLVRWAYCRACGNAPTDVKLSWSHAIKYGSIFGWTQIRRAGQNKMTCIVQHIYLNTYITLRYTTLRNYVYIYIITLYITKIHTYAGTYMLYHTIPYHCITSHHITYNDIQYNTTRQYITIHTDKQSESPLLASACFSLHSCFGWDVTH